MRAVHIRGSGRHRGMRTKQFYVDPSVCVGAKVKLGDVIGSVQDVAKHFNAEDTMENHIHFELWLATDPGPMFSIPQEECNV